MVLRVPRALAQRTTPKVLLAGLADASGGACDGFQSELV